MSGRCSKIHRTWKPCRRVEASRFDGGKREPCGAGVCFKFLLAEALIITGRLEASRGRPFSRVAAVVGSGIPSRVTFC